MNNQRDTDLPSRGDQPPVGQQSKHGVLVAILALLIIAGGSVIARHYPHG